MFECGFCKHDLCVCEEDAVADEAVADEVDPRCNIMGLSAVGVDTTNATNASVTAAANNSNDSKIKEVDLAGRNRRLILDMLNNAGRYLTAGPRMATLIVVDQNDNTFRYSAGDLDRYFLSGVLHKAGYEVVRNLIAEEEGM